MGGWVAGYFDEVVGAAMGDVFSKPYELLLGRKTYDIFAAHWPHLTDPGAPDYPIAEQFNRITKHVATHRPESLTWKNSRALGPDAVAALRELKKGQGPDLLTQGSSDFVQTLFANDLADELRVRLRFESTGRRSGALGPPPPRGGLKGFFWPRTRYASDDEAAAMAARIRACVRRE